MAAQRQQLHAAFGNAAEPVVQRAITVDTVDFDPVANERRHGIVAHAAVRAALSAALNADPFPVGPIRNQRTNVLDHVFGLDFSEPDIPTLTARMTEAIRSRYQHHAVILSHGQEANLRNLVQAALIANIQADPVHPMSAGERNAFDQLVILAGAGASRAKGAPSTLAAASVPAPLMGEINARIAEIQAERALWNVAAVTDAMLLRGGFVADITGRQRALHYQGNHSNVAGWLPAQAAPVDHVSAAATAIYSGASRKLQRILDGADPLTVLANGGQPHARRTEFHRKAARARAGMNNGQVVDSAMAALAAGVSGYIEFSMAHDISRLMYDPVNNRIFVTAHYKWRQGYNPFFRITGVAV
jgi:hypothetical protein